MPPPPPPVSPNTVAGILVFQEFIEKATQIIVLLNDLHTLRAQKKLAAGSTVAATQYLWNAIR